MEVYLLTDIFVLINLFGFRLSLGDGGIKLQVCTQKVEDGDAIPLVHSAAKVIPFARSHQDRDIGIDVCAGHNQIKVTLPFDTKANGTFTICYKQLVHTRSYTVCHSFSRVKVITQHTYITCWLQRNITQMTFVSFYAKFQSQTDGNDKLLTYYSDATPFNKGMCRLPICERVEPKYHRYISCGQPWQMILPNNSVLYSNKLTCTTCHNMDEEAVVINETSKDMVVLSLDKTLVSGDYNLTIWLVIEDDNGVEICPYQKVITVLCQDPKIEKNNTKLSLTGKSKNERHCEENPEQCSFGSFVLFGVAVSSVFMVLICFGTFLFVQRKRIARAICLHCCSNPDIPETMGSPTQLSPMLPNNLRRTSIPVSMHLPKHAHFHRLDDSFRLLFLPHPYDQFTRDCMECLRKILTLDGRIRSTCVFDQSISNEIFANKFNWIDNTINDIHNIVIFLCFTSLSVEHEPSIIDDVMKMCKLPSTRPTCQVILARVTESPNVTHDSDFLGTTFNIMNEKSYKDFLKSVYSIYGYKEEDDHDRQKLKQIVHCGASHHFLKRTSHHV